MADGQSSASFHLMSQQVKENQEDAINKREFSEQKAKGGPSDPSKILAADGRVTTNKLPDISEGITIRNINNQQYVGEITFGSPPQALSVMFDTGSSIIYALTSKCTKGCPGRLGKFLVENSGSFEDFTDKRQEQNYGQGMVQGDIAKD